MVELGDRWSFSRLVFLDVGVATIAFLLDPLISPVCMCLGFV